MRNVPINHQTGYTLTELVIVITVLGVVAAIAVPSFSSDDPSELELAVAEFADAIRFARGEAIRLGTPRGFQQQDTEKRLRVVSLDMAVSPPTIAYDVRHPITKQFYDVELDSHPFAAADTTARATTYRGTCNQQGRIYFDAQGTAWCADPENVLLEQFDVTLTLGSSVRVVTLHGFTGRVTVQ